MATDTLIETGYRRAVALLERNATPEGFVASSARAHYAAIWTRDAAIAALGAHLTGRPALLATARQTLATLARLQAPLGLLPNAYWPARGYWDWGEAGCTDATAWFLIAAWHYYQTTGDLDFIEALWSALQQALTWLRYQDANQCGLIDSPAGGDWMDSTLNRSGKVLYVNVLYYWAARGANALHARLGGSGALVDVADLHFKLNFLFWPSRTADYTQLLRHVAYGPTARPRFPHRAARRAFRAAAQGRRFYLSHVRYAQFVDKCDVWANLLAILCDLADARRAATILDYLDETRIAHPYPVRCWPEPERPADNRWGLLQPAVERYQAPQWRNPPYCYHNAGVWPVIGGFYVLALWKAGRREQARAMLARLAEANRLGTAGAWEFREWLEATSGAPRGAPYQSWNAGAYILAYKAVADNHLPL
ncbi:MAG TPA: amylo-alpha-1,6-glucosidase [Chloroflexota bacterium]|nr:amylo-alpha-1,6-glucosidase [Chloroflexota bacterium]